MGVKVSVIMFFSAILTLEKSIILTFQNHGVDYEELEKNYADENYDDMIARISSHEDEPKSNYSHTGIGITFPGTKWCGPGDRASYGEDLGMLSEIDKCCRGHDNCYDYITSGEMKHALRNFTPFTRLHCDCEDEFRECLSTVNSVLSNFIGYKYFRFKRYCFKLEYPIKGCREYQYVLISSRCIQYELDTTKYREWQWFDNAFW